MEVPEDLSFYSTAAQVIPILLLAAVVQRTLPYSRREFGLSTVPLRPESPRIRRLRVWGYVLIVLNALAILTAGEVICFVVLDRGYHRSGEPGLVYAALLVGAATLLTGVTEREARRLAAEYPRRGWVGEAGLWALSSAPFLLCFIYGVYGLFS